MKRFLLFDSGCSLCSELAGSIERETGGWLKARSLREPEVKALLDRARPGWRWEPMLLETDGDRARAFTGLEMRARLLVALGPRRAWRVAQLVGRVSMSPVDVDEGRRRFLKLLGGSAAAGLVLGLLPGSKALADGGPQSAAQFLKGAKITEVKGEEARGVIQRALAFEGSVKLEAALPGFGPLTDKAVAWRVTGPTHDGVAAAVPFQNAEQVEAFLFFSAVNGDTQSGAVVLRKNGTVISGADIYKLEEGAVVVQRVNGKDPHPLASPSSTTSNCTVNCMISCLQSSGCSGLALTLCVAALLSCPFFLASCIAAAVCTLYCGVAWSFCFTDVCCPGA